MRVVETIPSSIVVLISIHVRVDLLRLRDTKKSPTMLGFAQTPSSPQSPAQFSCADVECLTCYRDELPLQLRTKALASALCLKDYMCAAMGAVGPQPSINSSRAHLYGFTIIVVAASVRNQVRLPNTHNQRRPRVRRGTPHPASPTASVVPHTRPPAAADI